MTGRVGSGQPVSMLRKVLMSMMVIGAVGTTLGAGTFASFNASTANAESTFSAGSLVLSNAAPLAAACLSTGADGDIGTADEDGGGLNAKLCGSLLDVDLKRLGDSVTADLELENAGNIAGDLELFASVPCTTQKTLGPDGLPNTADDEPFDGLGDSCRAIQVTVQQYTQDWMAPSTCIYGGASCAFDTTKTLATFDDSTSLLPLTVGPVTPGSSIYVRIGLRLMNGPELDTLIPPVTSNTVQGRRADFDFTWRLNQG